MKVEFPTVTGNPNVIDASGRSLAELIRFLFRNDLPETLTFLFNGQLFHFDTEAERFQFALGMELVLSKVK